MKELEEVNQCPVTGQAGGKIYLDLGRMPLVNNLCETKEDSINCKKYPLAVQFFEGSKLSCLTHNPDPNLMFSEYSYKSGVSKPYLEHCSEFFDFLDEYLGVNPGDKILDIGGNDGSLLRVFLEKNSGIEVLNVDASENLAKVSLDSGVPTINDFWGTDSQKKIDKKFKIIVSTNVFQHTPPIADYVEAVSKSLEEGGIWCLEFPYWKSNVETKQYDQVYHEHVYYYLLTPLSLLFSKFGLEIVEAIKYPIHGGTLRLVISKKGEREISPKVLSLIEEEENINFDYYTSWSESIFNHIEECKNFLEGLKKEGKKIAGFGAAAKGCVFLNTAGIDYKTIDFVIDDTDLKQEKFIPGVGIQIKSREHLKSNNVDYILILAHNFRDRIVENLENDYKGKFITLFPEIEIF